MTDTARPLTVLTSMSAERMTTNPYVVELNRRLAQRVTLVRFTWSEVLTGPWDVFHVHWPDALVRRSGPLRTAAACALLAAGMLRARWTGRRVVRTVHNVDPHERQSRLVTATLRLVDRSTSGWIRLNDRTPVAGAGLVATIPHGTYADWFADAPHPARVPGRLLTAGLLRPYKGVDTLIESFADVDLADATLHVSGRPVDATYAADISAQAAADPRVSLDLRHVPDDVLATEIGEATLVALPYRELHNSGAALLALSLGRPVLVPGNDVTDDLAAEVGAVWVQRFTGELDAASLRRALAAVAGLTGAPDLSARSWEAIADQHVALYAAVADASGERSSERSAA